MELKQTTQNNSEMMLEAFKPVKIQDIEFSQPLPTISSAGADEHQIYARTMVLVRLHSHPLGLITLNFTADHIPAQQLADQVWAKFSEQINQHLEHDGLPTVNYLPVKGIVMQGQPACLVDRQQLLADAPMATIVISTRDRVQSLTNTLNSILALDYPKFEVILVDNAPQSNETHEYFKFIQPMFLRNNISLRYTREDIPGLALAHNHGLELVRTPYVAFTDDDVVVDKNWLTEIILGFKSAPSVGCVTGLVVPVELETPAQVLFEEYGGFVKGFKQSIYDMDKYRSKHPLYPFSPGHFGTGANMAYRTDVLKSAGGFDPGLGIGTPTMGADDLAAFLQTITSGHQLVYRPSALLFHQHRKTYESLKKQVYGYGTGLTVFLLKSILDHPSMIFDLVSKIPLGIKYAFDPHSLKNSRKSQSYPRELERIELKGMLNGPKAYLISRWRYRKYPKDLFKKRYQSEPTVAQHFSVNDWVEDLKGDKSTKEL